MSSFSILILTAAFCFPSLAAAAPERPVGIVCDSQAPWLTRHAAQELTRYVRRMGRRDVRCLSHVGLAQLTPGDYFLLGGPTVNRVTAELERHGRSPVTYALPEDEEAFMVESAEDGQRRFVILAGRTEKGTLYAVYHYLEKFCGVGFFFDGDRVEPRGALPFAGLHEHEQPRLRRRYWIFGIGHWGLKKFHATFWDFADWQRALDFLARNRLNLCNFNWFGPSYTSAWSRAFPEVPPVSREEKYTRYDLHPVQTGMWTWPYAYRDRLTRQVLDYGRKLGIRFVYETGYPGFPQRLVERLLAEHPELKYNRSNYGDLVLFPNQPLVKQLYGRYGRTLLRLFGTDHLYHDGPPGEFSQGATLEERQLNKLRAQADAWDYLHEIDPQAVQELDTWDLTVPDTVWDANLMRSVCERYRGPSFYVADIIAGISEAPPGYGPGSDAPAPPYQKYAGFYGADWMFQVTNAMASGDFLRGSVPNLIRRLHAALRDPQTGPGLCGLGQRNELTGSNLFLVSVVPKLAWNPEAVDFESYLTDYCRRRYGAASLATMKEAWRWAHAAMTTLGDGFNQCLAYRSIPHPYFTLFDDYQAPFVPALKTSMDAATRLRSALRLALRERPHQADNRLYENDMVDLAREYLGLLTNVHLLLAYHAFKRGDRQEWEAHASGGEACLRWLEAILSTRPDFSLQNTLDAVLRVPGYHPETAKMIQQGCVWGDYNTNDVYEQLHGYYRPRLRRYLSLVRQKLARGERTITAQEFTGIAAELRRRWCENPIWVPESERFQGQTLDAVERALREAPDWTSPRGSWGAEVAHADAPRLDLTTAKIEASSSQWYCTPRCAADGQYGNYVVTSHPPLSPLWVAGTPCPSWLEIGLPAPRQVEQVKIFHCDFANALTDFVVQVWDGQGWVDVETVQGNEVPITAHRIGRVTDRPRLVVAQAPGDHIARIAEVEVYGR